MPQRRGKKCEREMKEEKEENACNIRPPINNSRGLFGSIQIYYDKKYLKPNLCTIKVVKGAPS
jgi:hypothetical protein